MARDGMLKIRSLYFSFRACPASVVLMFAFWTVKLQAQCVDTDFSVVYNGVNALTVSQANLTCICPVGFRGGAATIAGPVSAGSVSTPGSVVASGSVTAAQFVGNGSSLVGLAAQPDVAALIAAVSQLGAMVANLTAQNQALSQQVTTLTARTAALESRVNTPVVYLSGSATVFAVANGNFGWTTWDMTPYLPVNVTARVAWVSVNVGGGPTGGGSYKANTLEFRPVGQTMSVVYVWRVASSSLGGIGGTIQVPLSNNKLEWRKTDDLMASSNADAAVIAYNV
eukprot:TRINITY_DN1139_c0_g3_i2.p1 TRINITY_DN1139_c0_g3~~TRINITY_DN1139_c0_g3_i2.p1  ORF type:complete len:283 (-),score=70.17 TRINITY_DN1139_c0_g3_i2:461-1309(-)